MEDDDRGEPGVPGEFSGGVDSPTKTCKRRLRVNRIKWWMMGWWTVGL